MELSPEAGAKSAFVTPLDKFEFPRCPFGLSQAPAYFQRLINQVIKGLPFAFVYPDDVLIHSPDIETSEYQCGYRYGSFEQMSPSLRMPRYIISLKIEMSVFQYLE